jgi:hypothetical protein
VPAFNCVDLGLRGVLLLFAHSSTRILTSPRTSEARRLDHMVDRIEFENTEAAVQQIPDKKPFVAPTISAPVDVLEATTFFQSVESGSTN